MAIKSKNHGKMSLSIRFLLIMNIIIILSFIAFAVTVISTTSTVTTNLAIKGLQDITDLLVNESQTTVNASITNHLRGIAEKNRDIVVEIYNQYETGVLSEDVKYTLFFPTTKMLQASSLSKSKCALKKDISNMIGKIQAKKVNVKKFLFFIHLDDKFIKTWSF